MSNRTPSLAEQWHSEDDGCGVGPVQVQMRQWIWYTHAGRGPGESMSGSNLDHYMALSTEEKVVTDPTSCWESGRDHSVARLRGGRLDWPRRGRSWKEDFIVILRSRRSPGDFPVSVIFSWVSGRNGFTDHSSLRPMRKKINQGKGWVHRAQLKRMIIYECTLLKPSIYSKTDLKCLAGKEVRFVVLS